MTPQEQEKVLRLVDHLKAMTTGRGCTEGEQDAAALKLGRLVIRYDLAVSFNGAAAPPPPTPPEPRPPDSFTYGPVDVIAYTERAILCEDREQEQFWIPRSQCLGACRGWERGDSGILYVNLWWAKKKGWTT